MDRFLALLFALLSFLALAQGEYQFVVSYNDLSCSEIATYTAQLVTTNSQGNPTSCVENLSCISGVRKSCDPAKIDLLTNDYAGIINYYYNTTDGVDSMCTVDDTLLAVEFYRTDLCTHIPNAQANYYRTCDATRTGFDLYLTTDTTCTTSQSSDSGTPGNCISGGTFYSGHAMRKITACGTIKASFGVPEPTPPPPSNPSTPPVVPHAEPIANCWTHHPNGTNLLFFDAQTSGTSQIYFDFGMSTFNNGSAENTTRFTSFGAGDIHLKALYFNLEPNATVGVWYLNGSTARLDITKDMACRRVSSVKIVLVFQGVIPTGANIVDPITETINLITGISAVNYQTRAVNQTKRADYFDVEVTFVRANETDTFDPEIGATVLLAATDEPAKRQQLVTAAGSTGFVGASVTQSTLAPDSAPVPTPQTPPSSDDNPTGPNWAMQLGVSVVFVCLGLVLAV